MDISKKKSHLVYWSNLPECLSRTCNSTGLKTQQGSFNWQQECPVKTTTEQAAFLSSKAQPLASSAWDPSLKDLPIGCSFPTPKPHPPRPSFWSTTSIQVYHANYTSAAILVKACASSPTCLSCVTRPSSAPPNHRAMQHDRRYFGLTLMIPEGPGLCTATVFHAVI